MKSLKNLIKSLISSQEGTYSLKRAMVLWVVLLFSVLLLAQIKADHVLVDALTILAGGSIAGNVAEKFSKKDS